MLAGGSQATKLRMSGSVSSVSFAPLKKSTRAGSHVSVTGVFAAHGQQLCFRAAARVC